MPSVEENVNHWSSYDWSHAGDEWSKVWGGTSFLWYGTLLPRVQSFLPASRILEIAPGFGRITQYLKDQCETLEIVDLTQRCIDACRERFAEDSRLIYHVNDGRSLEMISDGSIDFVFSFDSLVHAEADVLEAYIFELARKMKPDAIGFIHHSNVDGLKDENGKLPFENLHWRAESMSADRFADMCEQAGLEVLSQELVNWGGQPLTDSFSVFALPGSRWAPARGRHENPKFMDEALALGRIAELYHHS